MATSIVYLIHFETPFKHATHYLGSTNDLQARLAEHRRGRGSKLLKAVNAAGIDYDVVRTWKGDEFLEYRLKNLGGKARICPVCSPGTTEGTFKKAPKKTRWVRWAKRASYAKVLEKDAERQKRVDAAREAAYT